MLKILFLGEIIGLETVKKLKGFLQAAKQKFGIDMVIANADGASDGFGLLKNTAFQIHSSGINVITGGDLILNKKDSRELIESAGFFLRPYNLSALNIGRGYINYKLDQDRVVSVISILGRSNYNKIFASDPFFAINKLLEKFSDSKYIIVDFHGGTTSEIQAMQWYLAGKVTAVIGTSLRVLTSDNRVINDRTAVVTCNGYCGAADSIYGLSDETELAKIKTGRFLYSKIPTENIVYQGVMIEIDEESGKALSIEHFNQSADSN